MPSPRARPSLALRIPNYRRFIAGQGVSLIGSWTETIAQGVLVLQLTNSPLQLGIVAALRYLPVLLFAPYAGVIVDRHDRRRVLITTQSLLGGLSAVLGIAVVLQIISIEAVYVFALSFGVLTALDNPARMALIPELVDREALRDAITLNSILANVGRGVGPVVAAGLLATVGAAWCFFVNAGSFVFVVVALLLIDRSQMHPEGTVPRRGGQLRAALVVARRTPDILGPLAMMAVVGTLTYEFEVSFPLFAERSLDGGAVEYAWLTAAFGAGAVLAGLILIFWPQTGLRQMVWITVAYAAALALAATAPTSLWANAAVVLVGSASIGFLTTGNATIQLAAPAQMRGRITSLWTMAFTGSTPIGALIIGGVGALWGGRSTVYVAAAACAAAALVGWSILRRQPRV
ncbi:MFS transporter [Microbacterium sp. VKM Ac-2870]|uniref:MFS transporter n=1 Tax=Microbacterium sp. VKM Ac-2870 TaxID=2783825 RepID=UPI001889D5D3|nr:MFS transporter [Microbacterium sp. VKM Ac-2870]MBF4562535.1 MFS transporter [Microbacterium sp. VKM Ac-2870]